MSTFGLMARTFQSLRLLTIIPEARMTEPSSASTNSVTTRSTSTGNPTVSRSGGESSPASAGEQGSLQQNRVNVIDRVKQSATAQFATQKDRSIDALGSVTQAVRSSSQRLRDEKHETIASYVDQAVDQIDTWSRRIKEKDLDQLVTDVQRLARRQPAVFIGGAFAFGLLGARFLKSSRPANELGVGAESHRARYGGGAYKSAASDRSARNASGADAEVAISAHEAAIPDGSPDASRARTGTGSAGRSSRSGQSSARTERS
jgi:hypothetical protein